MSDKSTPIRTKFAVLPAVLGMLAVFVATLAYSHYKTQPLKQEDVQQIVRNYLLQNPELLQEVQVALEAQQQQELVIKQSETIAQNSELIYSSPYQIEIGDPQAKVTVVEFFDYNCGFCQRALADMEQLIDSNSDVRFILKEFPVLGQGSIEASRVSMAFSKVMPEQYAQFHIELLRMEGLKDGQRAMELALRMGADEQALLVEMENPGVIEAIQSTYEIANELGITGTPSYIIGNEVIFGAVGHEQLETHIQAQAE